MRYIIQEKLLAFGNDSTIKKDQVIATISKSWFKQLETYGVDIAPSQDDVLILACVLVLDLIGNR